MSRNRTLIIGAATTVVMVTTWLIYVALTDSVGAALGRAGMIAGFYLTFAIAIPALDLGGEGDGDEGSAPKGWRTSR